jgi:hypothetical protein
MEANFMAICDRCTTTIPTGDGYLVFSEATDMFGTVVGTELFCENCANGLFTDEIWATAKPTSVEIDLGGGVAGVRQAQKQVINFSIAIRAKRRGLTAAQAQQEARKIAQLWWKDKRAAERQLLAQR